MGILGALVRLVTAPLGAAAGSPAGTAPPTYRATCRLRHGSFDPRYAGVPLDRYRMPWSGTHLTPRVPITVYREHDPYSSPLILEPGDVVEAVGRGLANTMDPDPLPAHEWLWVKTGRSAGTCVRTEWHADGRDLPAGFDVLDPVELAIGRQASS